VLGNSKT